MEEAVEGLEATTPEPNGDFGTFTDTLGDGRP